MAKTIKWSLLILPLLLLGFITQWPDSKLHIISCDIGQGDATLITHRFTQVLIDAGPSQDKILSCLSDNLPFWDRQIEMIVISNNDADHYTGFLSVLDHYQVNSILVESILKDNQSFWALRQAIADHHSQIHIPQAGEHITVGDLKLTVLWPTEKLGSAQFWSNKFIDQQGNASNTSSGNNSSKKGVSPAYGGTDNQITMDHGGDGQVLGSVNVSESNAYSIVLKLTFNSFDALFTGDIGTSEEQALVNGGLIADLEFLKVAHHGSKYSSSSEFLQASRPDIAFVSAGAGNSYGHPTSEALSRLDTVGAHVWRTDQLGTLKLTTDGTKYTVETSSP